MAISIQIDSNDGGAAFEDDERGEIIRALYFAAHKLEEGRSENFKVYDSNGNACGKVIFNDED